MSGRRWAGAGFLLTTALICWVGTDEAIRADVPKWTVKPVEAAIPKSVSASIQAVLSPTALEVQDETGKPVATLWRRKELPLQQKGANSYAALAEGMLIGLIQWHQPWTDYRKQKVKPGVYTLRFARQPMDGDHMGTAPYNEFLLLVPAALDEKPDTLMVDELHELSGKTVGRSHPSMMLLFPYRKGNSDAATLTARPQDHLTLDFVIPVGGGGTLGFALTVVGHTMAE
jgi:hypothetical protein